jgi:DUF1707 SHOCT-like domain
MLTGTEVMSTQPAPPVRLASEDVIISAPMSYSGSAQRIMRLRRRARSDGELVAITVVAVSLVLIVWVFVTVWYLMWTFLLVPYRLVRRSARQRRVEALRHRELLGTIQGSAAGSAQSIVSTAVVTPRPARPASERVSDADRERAAEELREHMLVGRLTAEEFDERLGQAHAARTRGELDAAMIDLPL